MLIKLSALLRKLSTGWVAILLTVGFLLFTALVLPAQNRQADALSGGMGSPDLSLFYTSTGLYAMAEAYGEAGRSAYVRARLTFDVYWPLVYTIFLCGVIAWALGKALSAVSRWHLLNLFPLLALLLDYLENLSTALVMYRYPLQTPVFDLLAGIFTPLKWLAVGCSFLLLVFTLGLAVRSILHKHR